VSRNIVLGILIGALLVGGAWAVSSFQGPRDLSGSAAEPYGFRVGERVPDLGFTTLDGWAGSLSSFASASAIVLVVRDTGCPVSGRYGPRLSRMEQEYGERGVQFVYLNLGPHETREGMQEEVETFGFAGHYVHDPKGTFGHALRIRATTEVFVLDPSLTLVYRGAVDDQYGIQFTRPEVRERWLEPALDAVLAGTVPEVRSTEVPGCLLGFDSEPGHAVDHAGHGGGEGGEGVPLHPAAANGSTAVISPAVTYHNRVSRILQENCVACHRDGGIAPFSLERYENANAYRHMIQYVVQERIMPPWYADPDYGRWANDRSLRDEDRRALFEWIENGTPEGNPAEAAAPRSWTHGWNIGDPDAVFRLPRPVTIPAEGVVPYQYISVETDFEEDRWIRKIEIRPTAPEVTHHVIVFLEEPGQRPVRDGGVQGFFAATAPGAVGVDFGEGRGKRLPAGSTLVFQLHYTPNGREVQDQSQIGFVFHDEKPEIEVETRSAFNVRFRIPPHAENHPVSGDHIFRADGEILAFFPHTHVRGVAFRYELVREDGSSEIVLDIPRYNFDWQLTYQSAEPIPVRSGDILRATAWYDNSANNPSNPDPTAEVRFGEQTWDEMMLGYFDWIRTGPVAQAPGARTRAGDGIQP
jgi:mono/diheme cytochrome c family protein